MSEQVDVLRLGERRYAAEVHEGEQTTEHRVTFGQDTLEDLTSPPPAENEVVAESVRYLLEKEPSTSLPHDIDLGEIRSRDEEFIPELRARLGG
ncbi:hypothetical protein [Actinopolyspora saharensis]|uniref:Uncharacterized protein n=1 Tax=Actinopolyspora saharensis TaxID=995062 RepID=A0A1H1FU91_9ACTN|nr:hypothetical protein [Actinopolyspora saharensis]SDR04289.1 hypothetical protein SAMN04489718_3231 [Actinopolyspora saharensis]